MFVLGQVPRESVELSKLIQLFSGEFDGFGRVLEIVQQVLGALIQFVLEAAHALQAFHGARKLIELPLRRDHLLLAELVVLELFLQPFLELAQRPGGFLVIALLHGLGELLGFLAATQLAPLGHFFQPRGHLRGIRVLGQALLFVGDFVPQLAQLL